MTRSTDFTVCVLCDAICGLEVEHDGMRVLKVRGDPQDPLSRGYICPKGAALADVQNDPDRLRRPQRRRGDRWEEVSWEEALSEAARRLHEIQDRHGPDAVALYIGNPTGHSYAAILYLSIFVDTLNTRQRFSCNSMDGLPRMLASSLIYGNQLMLPVPDIDRTHFLLMLGANPVVSNGSLMTAPDAVKRLRALRARDGRLVVVDPRRTETARLADTHLFIRPGGDALLLAAMLHTLFAERLARPGELAAKLEGWDRIPELVAPFAPVQVADAVGIRAGTIAQLARDFAAAPSAACYGRIGTCTQEFGTVTSWLIDLLNIATGNMDRRGGAMFTAPAVDIARLARWLRHPGEFNRWQSRVGGLPEFDGELPVAAFADEIETPGKGQIRGLVTVAGNPVLSFPNSRRVERRSRVSISSSLSTSTVTRPRATRT